MRSEHEVGRIWILTAPELSEMRFSEEKDEGAGRWISPERIVESSEINNVCF